MDIRFLGHPCFELTEGDTRVLIDPFLTGNPKAAVEAADVDPTHIFLTHGHADHYGDIEDIAKRTNAQVVAIVEIADELAGTGVENVSDPNMGGTVVFDDVWVRLVPAWHTSTTPKGTVERARRPRRSASAARSSTTSATPPLLRPEARRRARPDRRRPDVHRRALHDGPPRRRQGGGARRRGTVIPCHYNTFPPIETDAEAFKADVESQTSSKVEILEPGETFST